MYQQRFAARADEGHFGDATDRAERPIIVANPADDAVFKALIDSMLATGSRRPETLEALLRTRYPHALVRPRELAGERTEVWYVYRDGHWIGRETDAGSGRR
jgi:hypothetical protein